MDRSWDLFVWISGAQLYALAGDKVGMLRAGVRRTVSHPIRPVNLPRRSASSLLVRWEHTRHGFYFGEDLDHAKAKIGGNGNLYFACRSTEEGVTKEPKVNFVRLRLSDGRAMARFSVPDRGDYRHALFELPDGNFGFSALDMVPNGGYSHAYLSRFFTFEPDRLKTLHAAILDERRPVGVSRSGFPCWGPEGDLLGLQLHSSGTFSISKFRPEMGCALWKMNSALLDGMFFQDIDGSFSFSTDFLHPECMILTSVDYRADLTHRILLDTTRGEVCGYKRDYRDPLATFARREAVLGSCGTLTSDIKPPDKRRHLWRKNEKRRLLWEKAFVGDIEWLVTPKGRVVVLEWTDKLSQVLNDVVTVHLLDGATGKSLGQHETYVHHEEKTPRGQLFNLDHNDALVVIREKIIRLNVA